MKTVIFTCIIKSCEYTCTISALVWSMGSIHCPRCGFRNDVREKEALVVGSFMTQWNDDYVQVLDERWAHGLRLRLIKEGSLFYVTNKLFLCKEADEIIDYINSESSDSYLWFIKYHHALLYGMDNLELILPYPWMYEIGEPTDNELEDEEWLLNVLSSDTLEYDNIICPHCKDIHYDKKVVYEMMRRFNISKNVAILQCPTCKDEFEYGYNEYYQVIGVNEQ